MIFIEAQLKLCLFFNQHETTFTGKNPLENALNITILTLSSVSSSVPEWSRRQRGMQAVRVQASTVPSVFFCCCRFFFRFFFISWYVFLLFPLLQNRFEMIR